MDEKKKFSAIRFAVYAIDEKGNNYIEDIYEVSVRWESQTPIENAMRMLTRMAVKRNNFKASNVIHIEFVE